MIFDVPARAGFLFEPICVCVLFCPRWFCRWKVFVDEDIMQYADKVAVREAEMSNKLVKKTSFVSY